MISTLFSSVKEFLSLTFGAILLSPIIIPTVFLSFIKTPFTFWRVNQSEGGYVALFIQIIVTIIAVSVFFFLFRKEYMLAFSAVAAGMALTSFLNYLPYLLKIKELSASEGFILLSIPTAIIFAAVSAALFFIGIK